MMTKRVMARTVLASAVLMAGQVTAGTIQRRKKHQEHRIEAGEKSGRLSPSEGAKLEKQEDAINKEEQAMREANNGRLSKGQRRVIRKQQKRESRRIYHEKHDQNDR